MPDFLDISNLKALEKKEKIRKVLAFAKEEVAREGSSAKYTTIASSGKYVHVCVCV